MKRSKKSTREDTGSEALPQKVPKHHHCPVCGMPISLDRETCSKECEERFRKVRRARYHALVPILILIMAIVIVIIRSLYRF